MNAKVRKSIENQARHWANQTQHPTAAYKLKDGSVVYTLAEFPISGTFVVEVIPDSFAQSEPKAA